MILHFVAEISWKSKELVPGELQAYCSLMTSFVGMGVDVEHGPARRVCHLLEALVPRDSRGRGASRKVTCILLTSVVSYVSVRTHFSKRHGSFLCP